MPKKNKEENPKVRKFLNLARKGITRTKKDHFFNKYKGSARNDFSKLEKLGRVISSVRNLI